MYRIKSHEVVPQAKTGLAQLNCDIANELGVMEPQDIYIGTIISKKYKTFDGNIVMRLIELSEDEIIGKR